MDWAVYVITILAFITNVIIIAICCCQWRKKRLTQKPLIQDKEYDHAQDSNEESYDKMHKNAELMANVNLVRLRPLDNNTHSNEQVVLPKDEQNMKEDIGSTEYLRNSYLSPFANADGLDYLNPYQSLQKTHDHESVSADIHNDDCTSTESDNETDYNYSNLYQSLQKVDSEVPSEYADLVQQPRDIVVQLPTDINENNV